MWMTCMCCKSNYSTKTARKNHSKSTQHWQDWQKRSTGYTDSEFWKWICLLGLLFFNCLNKYALMHTLPSSNYGHWFKSQFGGIQWETARTIRKGSIHRSVWSRPFDVISGRLPLVQMLEDIAVTCKPLYEWTSVVQRMKRPHKPHVRSPTDLTLNPSSSTWSPSSSVLFTNRSPRSVLPPPSVAKVFHFIRVARVSVKPERMCSLLLGREGGGCGDGRGLPWWWWWWCCRRINDPLCHLC